MTSRATAIEELGARDYDLLVVGAGIVGASIAAHAARAGLAVALVDKGDFGSATSSASSKLIHGGLRYLELGDVRLVHEAHRERRLLTSLVAPHLVRRLPFLLPLYRGGRSPLVVHAGLAAYAALARSRLSRPVKPDAARDRVPSLRTTGLRSCGLYADAVTHDARLTLANVRAAADAGTTVVNYATVEELRVTAGRVVGAELRVDGESLSVRARHVVNAAGPWVDGLRRLEDPAAAPSVRFSKGVHVVLPLEEDWRAALVVPQPDARVSFAIPWFGMLLLGTTDHAYDGPLDKVVATDGEVAQVLAEARVGLEPALVDQPIRSTFAGLRVLPLGSEGTARAHREVVMTVGRAGMLSIAGGKLTTYRVIALQALRRLGIEVDPAPWALPGAVEPDVEVDRLPVHLPLETRAHLVRLYGSYAGDVIAPAAEDPSLLEPIAPGAPDIRAQALYAHEHEWAVTAEDVLRRRTTVALRGIEASAQALA